MFGAWKRRTRAPIPPVPPLLKTPVASAGVSCSPATIPGRSTFHLSCWVQVPLTLTQTTLTWVSLWKHLQRDLLRKLVIFFGTGKNHWLLRKEDLSTFVQSWSPDVEQVRMEPSSFPETPQGWEAESDYPCLLFLGVGCLFLGVCVWCLRSGKQFSSAYPWAISPACGRIDLRCFQM